MFLLGFILGFMLCFVFFLVSFLTIREIIYKWGKVLRNRVESELNNWEDRTIDKTQIIYPDNSVEIFNKEESKIDDLLK